MDYIANTNNNRHIVSFFSMCPDRNGTAARHLLLKNALFRQTHSKSLIKFHLDIIDTNDFSDFNNVDNLLYMFEEIAQNSPEQRAPNEYIADVLNHIVELPSATYDGKHELTLPRKHFIAAMIMIYWSEAAKNVISDIPFFKTVRDITNKKQINFAEELAALGSSIRKVYQLPYNYDTNHQHTCTENIFNYHEKYLANFMFVFLYAAIKTETFSYVENIFEYENFLIVDTCFPCNMEVKGIHRRCAEKFLNSRHELGRDILPRAWFSDFNSYLDPRMHGTPEYYTIDTRFLLPYYNQTSTGRGADQNDLIFNEDFDTLAYISKHLGPTLCHPVLEVAVQLKSYKYKRIASLNLVMLFIFALISLFVVLGTYFGGLNEHRLATIVLVVRLVICGVYEYFRYAIRRPTYRERTTIKHTLPIITCLGIVVVNITHVLFPSIFTYLFIFVLCFFDICAIVLRVFDWCDDGDVNNRAEMYIENAELIRIFYALCEDQKLDIVDCLLFWALRKTLNVYPCLHRLHTVFVHRKSGVVYIPDVNTGGLCVAPIKMSAEFLKKCLSIQMNVIITE